MACNIVWLINHQECDTDNSVSNVSVVLSRTVVDGGD